MDTEAPRKAQDLRQTLNLFDPEQPLWTRAQLEHFSVERLHSPIEEIQILLESTGRPEKFLFSGHRGSGKSTELARLIQRLGDEFRVVEFSVMRQLDLFELQYRNDDVWYDVHPVVLPLIEADGPAAEADA